MSREDLIKNLDTIIEIGIVNAHDDKKSLEAVRDQLLYLWNDMDEIRSCKVCAYCPPELCDPDADETTEAFDRWRECHSGDKVCWKWRMDQT